MQGQVRVIVFSGVSLLLACLFVFESYNIFNWLTPNEKIEHLVGTRWEEQVDGRFFWVMSSSALTRLTS